MCGIDGILSTTKKDVGVYIYDALTIIQHRGQDAAGTVSYTHLTLPTILLV